MKREGSPPICLHCKHFYRDADDLSCEAFPNGIPDSIVMGEFVHVIPYPEDNGILFSPLPEFKILTIESGRGGILSKESDKAVKYSQPKKLVLKSFEGHQGRKGKVGGSLPKRVGIMPAQATSYQIPPTGIEAYESLQQWLESIPVDEREKVKFIRKAVMRYHHNGRKIVMKLFGDLKEAMRKRDAEKVGYIRRALAAAYHRYKEFPDHKGRPGKVGGSLPRGVTEIKLYDTEDQIPEAEMYEEDSKGYFILPNNKLVSLSDEFGPGTNDHVGYIAATENPEMFGLSEEDVPKFLDALDEGDGYTISFYWQKIYDSGVLRVREFENTIYIQSQNVDLPTFKRLKKLYDTNKIRYNWNNKLSNVWEDFLSLNIVNYTAEEMSEAHGLVPDPKEEGLWILKDFEDHKGRPGLVGGSLPRHVTGMLKPKFSQGKTTYKCGSCGKMTRDTGRGEAEVELCAKCYQEQMEENYEADRD